MGVDPLLSGKSASGSKLPDSGNIPLIASVICGTIFGFVMQKGHVYEPSVIRGQMLFQEWNMMKMFLSAAAMSVVAIAVVAVLVPGGRSKVVGARAWAFTGYRGTVAALLGGMTLGAGMSLAGACPGTVLIQVGSGVRWSLFTVGGALVGALVFSILEPSILRDSGILRAGMLSKPTWDSLIRLPYVVIAGFMAVVFAGAVYYIENYISGSGSVSLSALSVTATKWPSWVSGIVVGFLQLPMLIFASETLGASRAYVTLVANVLYFIVPKFVNNNSYLTGAKSGNANMSQLLFVFFACVGSFLSCFVSHTSFSGVSGFTPLSSFVGGVLIVFGGRLAGGCTSGQGLSGNGVLAINGMIATAGIFMGAIPVAKFAQASGF